MNPTTPERAQLDTFLADASPLLEVLRGAILGDSLTAQQHAQNMEQVSTAARDTFDALWDGPARVEHYEAGASALSMLLGIIVAATPGGAGGMDAGTLVAILSAAEAMRQCRDGASLAAQLEGMAGA